MIKIAIIVPEDMVRVAKLAVEEFIEQIVVVQGSMDDGLELAKRLENEGYDAIIARGGTHMLLAESAIDIPVISVPITLMDIYHSIKEAEKIGEDVSLMVTSNMVQSSRDCLQVYGKDIGMCQVSDEIEAEQKIKEIAQRGSKVLVGAGIINKYASKYGLMSVVIKSGKEVFVSSIEEAIRIVMATRKEKKANRLFKAVIDNSYEAVICIDKDKNINIVNHSAQKLLNCYSTDVLGKPIETVLPELKLGDTLSSGMVETGIIKSIKNNKFMISKIPIIVKNEVINVVAVLRDIDEMQRMEEKIRKDIAVTGHYTSYTFEDVIGNSESLGEIIRIGKEYAKVQSTVLIEGETGTGKEVIAQSIHSHGNRSNRPFVAVNCAALPEALLESELFGYAPGAFTGADPKGKRGLFEVAHTGTIFLDEISEMVPSLQGRLLRVLQEKQVMRVGGSKIIPIDIRVITATNQNLKSLVEMGKFREDLYYRLDVLKLKLTPLRERRSDILALLDYFLAIYCRKLKKETLVLTPEVKQYLSEYSWPGNVREVRNFCERLAVMMKKTEVSIEDVTSQILNIEVEEYDLKQSNTIFQKDNETSNNILNLEEMEKNNIQDALKNTDGAIMEAAEKLGISRTTLWRKMKKYNIKN